MDSTLPHLTDSVRLIVINPKHSRRTVSKSHGSKRRRYSIELMKAFTISALTKSPLKLFSLFNQTKRTTDEVIKAICEQEPTKPSQARSEPPAIAGGWIAANKSTYAQDWS
jgi:hypothetical protein